MGQLICYNYRSCFLVNECRRLTLSCCIVEQAAMFLYGDNAITNFGLEACKADTDTPVRVQSHVISCRSGHFPADARAVLLCIYTR